MTGMRALALMVVLPLALAACGRADDAPGGVSADEARALNDAAEMQDINSVSADAVRTQENAQ
jgi:hypothetical protein